MVASANEGWHELQIPSRQQCPKLFYSFSTSEDSFIFLLTDLISIWDCSLDKAGILGEAARQHTSVDPSVSSDQFQVLLSKLRKGLNDGNNTLVRDTGGNSQTLLLWTSINLPHPLKPLEWTFTLRLQSSAELAERILHPSLHEVSVSQDKINSLLRIIKDKDHVISRLLDRIGNSAVDLGLIFPGISGFASRKGGHVSVADAKKHIPGMASFDEHFWTKEFANEEGYEGADRTGLTHLVRGCEKCFAHSKSDHENWVMGLPSSEQPDHRDSKESRSGTKSTRQKVQERDESTDSDDFEVSAPDLVSPIPACL